MLLNCIRTGEIFNQLANEEIMLNCSSPDRSIKLIGSISRILIYLPSVVSIIPLAIFFTGMKSCTNSSFSCFAFCLPACLFLSGMSCASILPFLCCFLLFWLFPFKLSCIIPISNPPEM